MKELLKFLSGIFLCIILMAGFVKVCLPKEELKTYKFTGGTFDVDVNVIVTEDTAKARQYISKFYECTSDDFNSRGVTFNTQDGYPVIMWFPNLKDKSVVNHELFHATYDILDWAGVILSDSTDEIFAYEFQYLYNQFPK